MVGAPDGRDAHFGGAVARCPHVLPFLASEFEVADGQPGLLRHRHAPEAPLLQQGPQLVIARVEGGDDRAAAALGKESLGGPVTGISRTKGARKRQGNVAVQLVRDSPASIRAEPVPVGLPQGHP